MDQKDFDMMRQMMHEVMREEISPLTERMGRLETKVNGLETKVNGLEAKVDGLEAKVEANAKAIREVQVTLENDIDRKINIIAEGHLDISRNLDKAIRVSQTQEEYQLRVVALETEVRRLKNRLKENA